ncbi:M20/M25/M40 family metallo-hydrolase [Sphingomicrobium sediminis]|uniref:M20/M25/M40 family metallo-hydrolase n=1 Tax=Sphingomicrobium sediminis TaxID=2950949 RepID=A0A9X2EIV3_9SPHN|nr:M20/M25/M40 family metallo-hydrolase [Sphingomicrobium sediminis]MCM8558320.1 M20/M25/M40 family metallo-hydrolase [Sphingomicrobium sediminis]
MSIQISRLALGALAFSVATPGFAQEMTGKRADENIVRGHVEFLADDLLEGRDTGKRGYDIAALYVASQYRAMGLEPAGDNGSWFQDVPFVRATPTASSATFTANGISTEMTAEQIAIYANVEQAEATVDAELVFVGYGLDEPLLGYNDYDGVDVRGKIVVAMSGIPSGQPSDIAAHLGNSKLQAAADNGAVGFIEITTAPEGRAERIVAFMAQRDIVDWMAPDGNAGSMPGDIAVRGMMTRAGAEMMLGRDLDAQFAQAAAGDVVDGFDVTGRLSASVTSTHESFMSANVVGRLPGSDASRDDEHVAMTAHLDHVGVNERARGEDKIFNGALDNAAGVATMLEAARLFTTMDERPDRSILFIALTGEEKGLRGAGYYANFPTVPLDSINAVVNLDMPVPLYEFNDVVAFGAEYNSVAEKVAEAGETLDIAVSPDPMPEQGIFTRSDHYRFAMKGIPAILLFTGYGGDGEAVFGDFFANHYHQPSDQLDLPIMWDQLAKYADLNYRIAYTIAVDEDRPLWYADNYFADRFDPDGERAPLP